MQMHSTMKRLAVLAVLAPTLGVAAPAASASAAPAAPAELAAFPFAAFPGFFPFGPGTAANGQSVVGPTATGAIIITTAPTSFINTNNQTSAGGNVTAGQVAGL
jgi:hypothetical protein